uniref:starch-binding protein n=1 Tax=Streptococcus orisratti TaxID=114652 RepID=UPI0029432287
TTITFDNPDNWSTVYAYMYSSKDTKLLGAWPGTQMTKDNSGRYSISVPKSYESDGVKVLFTNNQGAQYPQNIGFDLKVNGIYSKTGLTGTASEVEYKEEVVKENIPFETQTKENPELTKGETKTISEGKEGVKEVTYKVEYTDGVETAREKISEKTVTEATPKVVEVGTKEKEADEAIASRVYFNNSQNWNKVYAYVYDSQGKPVVGTWPGKEMSKDEYGYYIELSKDLSGGKIIFNNPDTKVQYPAQNKAGYDIELGHIYDIDGKHQAVLPEEGVTRITFDNPGGWDAANVYAYYGNPIQMPLGAWPGKAMTKDSQGNFYIDLPKTYADSDVKLIFNKPNSNIQFPSAVGFDFSLDGHYTKDGLK